MKSVLSVSIRSQLFKSMATDKAGIMAKKPFSRKDYRPFSLAVHLSPRPDIFTSS